MTAAISFSDVSAGALFEGISFEIGTGVSALMVTAGEVEGLALIRLITGLARPLLGSVHVNGQSVRDLTGAQLYQLRQQMGVVPANGGMISNLKLWENITLPLHYAMGSIPPGTEDYVSDCFDSLGLSCSLSALPAHLSLQEKRAAAFIRASLCQPRIMLYNHCFEDKSGIAGSNLFAAASAFQSATPGRTSIYLVSSADRAGNPPADLIIDLHDNSIEPKTGTA